MKKLTSYRLGGHTVLQSWKSSGTHCKLVVNAVNCIEVSGYDCGVLKRYRTCIGFWIERDWIPGIYPHWTHGDKVEAKVVEGNVSGNAYCFPDKPRRKLHWYDAEKPAARLPTTMNHLQLSATHLSAIGMLAWDLFYSNCFSSGCEQASTSVAACV